MDQDYNDIVGALLFTIKIYYIVGWPLYVYYSHVCYMKCLKWVISCFISTVG